MCHSIDDISKKKKSKNERKNCDGIKQFEVKDSNKNCFNAIKAGLFLIATSV
jgi:hypothetical protein